MKERFEALNNQSKVRATEASIGEGAEPSGQA